ncbi:MFS transporter [Actinobacillus equuli]|uniref:MFS transporter n=1 Tax=Actinobacillus equuli TaxID=718 RepID=UPI0024184960|nr:MFS transporter [Actinobacillus equuli]MDG4951783.1 MHS family MFS transporter [Actinobacillus equuli subsp. equuli]WGE42447.1 MHS family MFS transporter [Actinobacillus equuli subsp. haemolyticus]WGE59365.1 MHS family MFS transporter [Actinobacillus equuli subsp. haemolyticus]WGE61992.1 MHS family MFS transporter [Actinobacillus equuli subsp. haemolyticus]WGE81586.1 MHS family MFS transporter [Actinobacillus equuli subsp. haemolyticus]
MSNTAQNLRNDPKKVAIASMVGTAIEFFDYYIYAAAAVLVFNTQFFKSGDPVSDELLSLSTLALAFFARPIGSALFGHFGDKIGRKKTLVASLLLMGGSTVCIGLLPTYADIGIWATVLLCLCRIGQGLGLGGEWGGAALVATENAPDGKRAWYGTFPQLGAPIGLFLANGAFFLVSYIWGKEGLVEWAWRIPFISSVVLVMVGLWVRLTLHESHVFREAEEKGKTQKAPVSAVFKHHMKPLILGTFIMTATYVLFYIMTAFAQVYSRTPAKLSEAGHPMGLGIEPNTFTGLLLLSAIVFGAFTSISGLLADKVGRRKFLLWVTFAMGIFGLAMPLFLSNGTPYSVFAFLVVGMALMGFTFGPMAALLPELFPTEVRYSGASLAYNFASIVGATVAATFAIKINAAYGILGVGIYLAANAVLTLIALFMSKETKDLDLTKA